MDGRDRNHEPTPRPAVVAIATLAVYALIEPLRGYVLDVFGLQRGRYRDLLDIALRHYTWYLVAPLALAALLFGVRRALPALGLAADPFVALLFAGLCTLPMFVGYASYGELSSSPTLLADSTRYALLPGVMEEIVFRGMLFGFLFRFAGWGFVPAAMVNAVVFGIGHLWQGRSPAETAGVFAVTALGAAWFSWLYVEWRMNLWVPIAFHVLMNLSWDLFAMGESALGGGAANVFRFATVGASVVVTLVVARRRGRVVRGRRWWRGEEGRSVAVEVDRR
jgi:membrane protease YdiL (CAAX protease family)